MITIKQQTAIGFSEYRLQCLSLTGKLNTWMADKEDVIAAIQQNPDLAAAVKEALNLVEKTKVEKLQEYLIDHELMCPQCKRLADDDDDMFVDCEVCDKRLCDECMLRNDKGDWLCPECFEKCVEEEVHTALAMGEEVKTDG